MDKYDERKKQSSALLKKRATTLIAFSVIFITQIIVILLVHKYKNLTYAVFLFLLLDFGYGIEYLRKELFIRQIKESLDTMEANFSAGRYVLYPMPISSEIGSSDIWESLRGRVVYRYRYHSRNFDCNFLPVDSTDPASCAWSAAWFYINDDLNHLLSIECAEEGSFQCCLVAFALKLGIYGLQHDFISDISWDSWYNSFYSKYKENPATLSLLKQISPKK